MPNYEQYAHVLLFVCSRCGRPVPAACISTRSNLETAQIQSFTIECVCGGTGDFTGVTAMRHWVEPWRVKNNVLPGDAGSCDPNPLSRAVR
jgi:hypothetical protein